MCLESSDDDDWQLKMGQEGFNQLGIHYRTLDCWTPKIQLLPTTNLLASEISILMHHIIV